MEKKKLTALKESYQQLEENLQALKNDLTLPETLRELVDTGEVVDSLLKHGRSVNYYSQQDCPMGHTLQTLQEEFQELAKQWSDQLTTTSVLQGKQLKVTFTIE